MRLQTLCAVFFDIGIHATGNFEHIVEGHAAGLTLNFEYLLFDQRHRVRINNGENRYNNPDYHYKKTPRQFRVQGIQAIQAVLLAIRG